MKKKEKPYDVRKALTRRDYKPVILEVVYPDGRVMIRNAFKDENSAVMGQDPKWPRERLIDHAIAVSNRWSEVYWWMPGTLRVSR